MENNQNYENQVNDNQVNDNQVNETQVNETQVNYDYSVPQGDVEPVVMDAPEKDPSKGLAIASLVCGIASVVTSLISLFCCCGYASIPLSIAAIITGVISRKRKSEDNKFALIGIILGAVGVGVFVITIVIGIIIGVGASFAEGFSSGFNSTYY